jgi:hypothetical protein
MFTLSRDVESRGVGLRPQLSHLSGGLEIARRPWNTNRPDSTT